MSAEQEHTNDSDAGDPSSAIDAPAVSRGAPDYLTAAVRVAVAGASGRMGSTTCAAIDAADGTTLVAKVDPAMSGPGWFSSVAELDADDVDVLVDFTHFASARANLDWCLDAGVHAVVGTSGFDGDALADLTDKMTAGVNIAIIPNFAIGAVLMMRFAELAAPFMDTVEVIEYHHDQKIDAPSGTAIATVDRIAAASTRWAPDPTTDEKLPGARGALGAGDIRIHAVRMRGMVAHQEVLFGAQGQTLTLRHDSIDRSSFMPGVVLAVQQVSRFPGLTVGLDRFLGIDSIA